MSSRAHSARLTLGQAFSEAYLETVQSVILEALATDSNDEAVYRNIIAVGQNAQQLRDCVERAVGYKCQLMQSDGALVARSNFEVESLTQQAWKEQQRNSNNDNNEDEQKYTQDGGAPVAVGGLGEDPAVKFATLGIDVRLDDDDDDDTSTRRSQLNDTVSTSTDEEESSVSSESEIDARQSTDEPNGSGMRRHSSGHKLKVEPRRWTITGNVQPVAQRYGEAMLNETLRAIISLRSSLHDSVHAGEAGGSEVGKFLGRELTMIRKAISLVDLVTLRAIIAALTGGDSFWEARFIPLPNEAGGMEAAGDSAVNHAAGVGGTATNNVKTQRSMAKVLDQIHPPTTPFIACAHVSTQVAAILENFLALILFDENHQATRFEACSGLIEQWAVETFALLTMRAHMRATDEKGSSAIVFKYLSALIKLTESITMSKQQYPMISRYSIVVASATIPNDEVLLGLCGCLSNLAAAAKGRKEVKKFFSDMLVRMFPPFAVYGFLFRENGMPAAPVPLLSFDALSRLQQTMEAIQCDPVVEWTKKDKYLPFAVPVATTCLTLSSKNFFAQQFLSLLNVVCRSIVNEDRRVRASYGASLLHLTGFYFNNCCGAPREITMQPAYKLWVGRTLNDIGVSHNTRARELSSTPLIHSDVDGTPRSSTPADSVPVWIKDMKGVISNIREIMITFLRKQTIAVSDHPSIAMFADIVVMMCRSKVEEGVRLIEDMLPSQENQVFTATTLVALYALVAVSEIAFSAPVTPDVCDSAPSSGKDLLMPYWGLGAPSGSGPLGAVSDLFPKLYSPFSSFRHSSQAEALLGTESCWNVAIDMQRLTLNRVLSPTFLRFCLDSCKATVSRKLHIILMACEKECLSGNQHFRNCRMPTANADYMTGLSEKDRNWQHLTIMALLSARYWCPSPCLMSFLPKLLLHNSPYITGIVSHDILPFLVTHPDAPSHAPSAVLAKLAEFALVNIEDKVICSTVLRVILQQVNLLWQCTEDMYDHRALSNMTKYVIDLPHPFAAVLDLPQRPFPALLQGMNSAVLSASSTVPEQFTIADILESTSLIFLGHVEQTVRLLAMGIIHFCSEIQRSYSGVRQPLGDVEQSREGSGEKNGALPATLSGETFPVTSSASPQPSRQNSESGRAHSQARSGTPSGKTNISASSANVFLSTSSPSLATSRKFPVPPPPLLADSRHSASPLPAEPRATVGSHQTRTSLGSLIDAIGSALVEEAQHTIISCCAQGCNWVDDSKMRRLGSCLFFWLPTVEPDFSFPKPTHILSAFRLPELESKAIQVGGRTFHFERDLWTTICRRSTKESSIGEELSPFAYFTEKLVVSRHPIAFSYCLAATAVCHAHLGFAQCSARAALIGLPTITQKFDSSDEVRMFEAWKAKFVVASACLFLSRSVSASETLSLFGSETSKVNTPVAHSPAQSLLQLFKERRTRCSELCQHVFQLFVKYSNLQDVSDTVSFAFKAIADTACHNPAAAFVPDCATILLESVRQFTEDVLKPAVKKDKKRALAWSVGLVSIYLAAVKAVIRQPVSRRTSSVEGSSSLALVHMFDTLDLLMALLVHGQVSSSSSAASVEVTARNGGVAATATIQPLPNLTLIPTPTTSSRARMSSETGSTISQAFGKLINALRVDSDSSRDRVQPFVNYRITAAWVNAHSFENSISLRLRRMLAAALRTIAAAGATCQTFFRERIPLWMQFLSYSVIPTIEPCAQARLNHKYLLFECKQQMSSSHPFAEDYDDVMVRLSQYPAQTQAALLKSLTAIVQVPMSSFYGQQYLKSIEREVVLLAEKVIEGMAISSTASSEATNNAAATSQESPMKAPNPQQSTSSKAGKVNMAFRLSNEQARSAGESGHHLRSLTFTLHDMGLWIDFFSALLVANSSFFELFYARLADAIFGSAQSVFFLECCLCAVLRHPTILVEEPGKSRKIGRSEERRTVGFIGIQSSSAENLWGMARLMDSSYSAVLVFHSLCVIAILDSPLKLRETARSFLRLIFTPLAPFSSYSSVGVKLGSTTIGEREALDSFGLEISYWCSVIRTHRVTLSMGRRHSFFNKLFDLGTSTISSLMEVNNWAPLNPVMKERDVTSAILAMCCHFSGDYRISENFMAQLIWLTNKYRNENVFSLTILWRGINRNDKTQIEKFCKLFLTQLTLEEQVMAFTFLLDPSAPLMKNRTSEQEVHLVERSFEDAGEEDDEGEIARREMLRTRSNLSNSVHRPGSPQRTVGGQSSLRPIGENRAQHSSLVGADIRNGCFGVERAMQPFEEMPQAIERVTTSSRHQHVDRSKVMLSLSGFVVEEDDEIEASYAENIVVTALFAMALQQLHLLRFQHSGNKWGNVASDSERLNMWKGNASGEATATTNSRFQPKAQPAAAAAAAVVSQADIIEPAALLQELCVAHQIDINMPCFAPLASCLSVLSFTTPNALTNSALPLAAQELLSYSVPVFHNWAQAPQTTSILLSGNRTPLTPTLTPQKVPASPSISVTRIPFGSQADSIGLEAQEQDLPRGASAESIASDDTVQIHDEVPQITSEYAKVVAEMGSQQAIRRSLLLEEREKEKIINEIISTFLREFHLIALQCSFLLLLESVTMVSFENSSLPLATNNSASISSADQRGESHSHSQQWQEIAIRMLLLFVEGGRLGSESHIRCLPTTQLLHMLHNLSRAKGFGLTAGELLHPTESAIGSNPSAAVKEFESGPLITLLTSMSQFFSTTFLCNWLHEALEWGASELPEQGPCEGLLLLKLLSLWMVKHLVAVVSLRYYEEEMSCSEENDEGERVVVEAKPEGISHSFLFTKLLPLQVLLTPALEALLKTLKTSNEPCSESVFLASFAHSTAVGDLLYSNIVLLKGKVGGLVWRLQRQCPFAISLFSESNLYACFWASFAMICGSKTFSQGLAMASRFYSSGSWVFFGEAEVSRMPTSLILPKMLMQELHGIGAERCTLLVALYRCGLEVAAVKQGHLQVSIIIPVVASVIVFLAHYCTVHPSVLPVGVVTLRLLLAPTVPPRLIRRVCSMILACREFNTEASAKFAKTCKLLSKYAGCSSRGGELARQLFLDIQQCAAERAKEQEGGEENKKTTVVEEERASLRELALVGFNVLVCYLRNQGREMACVQGIVDFLSNVLHIGRYNPLIRNTFALFFDDLAPILEGCLTALGQLNASIDSTSSTPGSTNVGDEIPRQTRDSAFELLGNLSIVANASTDLDLSGKENVIRLVDAMCLNDGICSMVLVAVGSIGSNHDEPEIEMDTAGISIPNVAAPPSHFTSIAEGAQAPIPPPSKYKTHASTMNSTLTAQTPMSSTQGSFALSAAVHPTHTQGNRTPLMTPKGAASRGTPRVHGVPNVVGLPTGGYSPYEVTDAPEESGRTNSNRPKGSIRSHPSARSNKSHKLHQPHSARGPPVFTTYFVQSDGTYRADLGCSRTEAFVPSSDHYVVLSDGESPPESNRPTPRRQSRKGSSAFVYASTPLDEDSTVMLSNKSFASSPHSSCNDEERHL